MILTQTDTQIQTQIAAHVLQSLNLHPQRTTVVHCVYHADVVQGDVIRVWNCTILQEDTGRQCKLVHAEGIPVAPMWMVVPSNTYHFTLVFEGLSKGCTRFTLDENIAEPGGWYIADIQRNFADVYTVDIREGIVRS